MRKKKVKKIEKKLRYAFHLIINLSRTVAELQAKNDIREERERVGVSEVVYHYKNSV
jgi:hypothetical protein